MIDRNRQLLFALFSIVFVSGASASVTIGNWQILKNDESGKCFVRSVPSSRQGSTGKTTVYRVKSGEDEVVQSFDWYSPGVAIKCGGIGPPGKDSISLVTMGRSHKSKLGETSGGVTLAFYLDGELRAEYSKIDLALLRENAGGYPRGSGLGFSKALGFRRLDSREGFEICTTDGRILAFDILSGDLVDQQKDITDRCEQRDSRYYLSLQRIVTTYYEDQTRPKNRWDFVIE